MKRINLFISTLFLAAGAWAQPRVRDVFAEMPEHILPLVSKNNRLDCIDFKESNMAALVNNVVDEPIELTELTGDYLKLKMSEVSWMEMKLLPTVDSTTYVICMVKTYRGPVADSSISFYSQDWKLLEDIKVPEPEVEDFLIKDTEAGKEYEDALLQLKDLPFILISLDADAPQLTLTLQAEELPKKEREYAEKHLRSLKFTWNGKGAFTMHD